MDTADKNIVIAMASIDETPEDDSNNISFTMETTDTTSGNTNPSVISQQNSLTYQQNAQKAHLRLLRALRLQRNTALKLKEVEAEVKLASREKEYWIDCQRGNPIKHAESEFMPRKSSKQTNSENRERKREKMQNVAQLNEIYGKTVPAEEERERISGENVGEKAYKLDHMHDDIDDNEDGGIHISSSEDGYEI